MIGFFKRRSYKLNRELGIVEVTFAGVGIILGAGIYALIGLAAESAGNAVWLSFLISALVAAFTGYSYAELSSFFKGDAAEYDYCNAGLGRKTAYLVAFLIIFTGIVSAATVALGFAGYFIQIVDIPYFAAGFLVILAMTLLNLVGLKESNWFNIIAVITGVLGLIMIIVIGLPKWGSVDLTMAPKGFGGIMQSAALVFFAFLGFETVVKLREEARDPDRTIPRALLLSILITAVLYVLLGLSVVSVYDSANLVGSSSPLADIAQMAFGNEAFLILVIIALFSTANTVLLSILATSRMLYGMAVEGSAPSWLAKVGKRTRIPYVAVLITFFCSSIFMLLGDIRIVAIMTNILLLFTFVLVNFSAIVLRYKNDSIRPFKMPFNIGKFPVLSLAGVICSLVLLVYSFIDLLS